MMNINKQSLLPLYHQVEESLRQDIANGVYLPDHPVPTEIELQRNFNVSRETVRKAVNNLVLAGLVEKRKGKGTYVTHPKIVHRIGHIYGSTEEILTRGMTPGTSFIEKKEIRPSETMRREMELKKGVKVIKVKRVRFANEEPVAILSSYLPKDLVPDLTRVKFRNNSLYKTLEEIYNLTLSEGDEIIEVGSIGSKDANFLRIRKGTPVLVVKRLTYLDNSRVIEKLTALYRSDKFKYQVKLRGRPYDLGFLPAENVG
ncbi:GntR family transcriptional regulator, partial [bacterium]|nr:GntR family transcriptional regulator [bacterium]